MKDVVVKSLGGKLCYGVVSINGKEYKVNSEFTVLAKIYNEMFDTEYSFNDIVKKYQSQLKDKDDSVQLN